MLNTILALSVFIGLFILLFVSVILGRRFGKWQIRHDASHKLRVVNVAEGALFALLGLLVAFTFTGAYERFEARKVHIVEEANAIDTAYLRIKLLAPATQSNLRESFRQYLDSRLGDPEKLLNSKSAEDEIPVITQLRAKIWDQAVSACNITGSSAVTELFITAVNNMFDIANTRFSIAKIHPPVVIFFLLIGLAVLSSFLAGYSTAKSKVSHSIHTLSYVAITAFTLYIIIDLEFPRLGMIRVDRFDQILIEVKDVMN